MTEVRRDHREPHARTSPMHLPGGGPCDTSGSTPRLVGVVWGLLLLNTLAYTYGTLIVPFSRSVAQIITMGALASAFGLALVLNPRIRVRPSAYLFLLSMLALANVASSLRLEAGIGSLFRCFRLVLFVATLWLLSGWWRGDLRLARIHARTLAALLLTVLAGLVISPASAFAPEGRLVGAIWPLPATQVGMYSAIVIGLCVVLWITRSIDGRSAAFALVPAVVFLLLSHTRTALLGLIVALIVAGLSLVLTNARARRVLATAMGLGVPVAVVFGQVIQTWWQRGQDAGELANLTGRQKVWDLLLGSERTISDQIFGTGLGDKSFEGLPIDSTWLAVYHEQGYLGVAIVVAIFACLLGTAALRPPSPARACAIFLVTYCIFVSYTEVTIGDASPYVLHLAAAAALLIRPTGSTAPYRTPEGVRDG